MLCVNEINIFVFFESKLKQQLIMFLLAQNGLRSNRSLEAGITYSQMSP